MSRFAHRWLRGLAVALAAMAIALALWWRQMPATGFAESAPIVAVLEPAPAIVQLPPLFAVAGATLAGPSVDAGPGDLPPELIGVAGRLPNDAEVLLRAADGSSITLRMGESAQGWTLVAIAADRATFERGAERQVVIIDPER
ncbi:MAG: hypothetical protein ABIT09_05535 [Croceibacterium sp.]